MHRIASHRFVIELFVIELIFLYKQEPHHCDAMLCSESVGVSYKADIAHRPTERNRLRRLVSKCTAWSDAPSTRPGTTPYDTAMMCMSILALLDSMLVQSNGWSIRAVHSASPFDKRTLKTATRSDRRVLFDLPCLRIGRCFMGRVPVHCISPKHPRACDPFACRGNWVPFA